ncbi:hypothetical protein SAY86_029941 [Trapa natans]|uniref:SBP-type domain-containing protein n=1 Tax=Trapa natans TaxID=22666 RepID=A0AAN7RDC3_TRANT|nr:hypothetical protein SAY86_029941 [Trapa natans]
MEGVGERERGGGRAGQWPMGECVRCLALSLSLCLLHTATVTTTILLSIDISTQTHVGLSLFIWEAEETKQTMDCLVVVPMSEHLKNLPLYLSSSIMEPISTALTDSDSSLPPTTVSSSSSSLLHHHGLNFGGKVYFEDHASIPAAPPPEKPYAASIPSSSSKKGKAVASSSRAGQVQEGQQPPRCQVAGCMVDLSHAKAYYSRHKVCGMHSKSPKVIVGGIEQRFCQQCSRFHQLTEFDQAKRSCRRRLAGHNERRRKPQPGFLLTSRYGHSSCPVFDNSSRRGSFVMDFSAYPRHLGRDAWPPTQSSDSRTTGQMVDHVKFPLHHPWQGCSENPPPPNIFLQDSADGGDSSFPSPGIPPEDLYTGMAANSTCALSLLSNQSWSSSRSQAATLGMMEVSTHQGPTTATTHGASQFTSTSWGFKAADGSADIPSHGGLGHLSQPLDSHFSRELELSQQSGKQYMELDDSRAFDASEQVHWSL